MAFFQKSSQQKSKQQLTDRYSVQDFKYGNNQTKGSRRRVKKNGFSMIELLVVTTIIIVLTTIGLVSYRSASMNARNGKRKADLESVRQALVLYRVDEGVYPVGSSFSGMTTAIADYLATLEVNDPSGDPYVYNYTSNGVTFSISALLEPDQTAYTLTNP